MPKRIWNRNFVSLMTVPCTAKRAHVSSVRTAVVEIMCTFIYVVGAFSGGLGETYFSSWVYGMQYLALDFPPLCET